MLHKKSAPNQTSYIPHTAICMGQLKVINQDSALREEITMTTSEKLRKMRKRKIVKSAVK